MHAGLVCSRQRQPAASRKALPDPAKLPTAQELEQAFSLFNEASAQLASAYQDLQDQVERLTAELAVANGELRRQYEEKEALSRRLALLLDALPGGVVVLDAAGRVLEANPVALDLLGGDSPGRAWSEVEGQRLAATAAPQEWQLRDAAGSPQARWVSIGASPLDPTGGRILLISEITEARRLREQLERHKRLSAMGEMAAGLAHQLRTPLATALLYAGNLARPALPDADRLRFAEKAQTRLRDLERMIQDLLTFVRGVPAARDLIELPELMHELAQVIEPQMASRGVRFDLSAQCAGAMLSGNRKALAGAFVNLLENALQACGAGGEVRLEARTEAGMALVCVTDSGPGMPVEVQERLFEPFFTTRTEGTGLGLAIVRSVVAAHGGDVRVESAPGRGAAFRVSLPLADTEEMLE
jgi:two-component system sensor histidine kinase FlrB